MRLRTNPLVLVEKQEVMDALHVQGLFPQLATLQMHSAGQRSQTGLERTLTCVTAWRSHMCQVHMQALSH